MNRKQRQAFIDQPVPYVAEYMAAYGTAIRAMGGKPTDACSTALYAADVAIQSLYIELRAARTELAAR